MPPYLNVYGQAQQKSKFWAQNIMFWPKIAIFNGPEIFKSVSAVWPHRDCAGFLNVTSFGPSFDPSLQAFASKGVAPTGDFRGFVIEYSS